MGRAVGSRRVLGRGAHRIARKLIGLAGTIITFGRDVSHRDEPRHSVENAQRIAAAGPTLAGCNPALEQGHCRGLRVTG
jgi:hypothetical protein